MDPLITKKLSVWHEVTLLDEEYAADIDKTLICVKVGGH